jgi:hypothetical protein
MPWVLQIRGHNPSKTWVLLEVTVFRVFRTSELSWGCEAGPPLLLRGFREGAQIKARTSRRKKLEGSGVSDWNCKLRRRGC